MHITLSSSQQRKYTQPPSWDNSIAALHIQTHTIHSIQEFSSAVYTKWVSIMRERQTQAWHHSRHTAMMAVNSGADYTTSTAQLQLTKTRTAWTTQIFRIFSPHLWRYQTFMHARMCTHAHAHTHTYTHTHTHTLPKRNIHIIIN